MQFANQLWYIKVYRCEINLWTSCYKSKTF